MEGAIPHIGVIDAASFEAEIAQAFQPFSRAKACTIGARSCLWDWLCGSFPMVRQLFTLAAAVRQDVPGYPAAPTP